MRLLVYTDVSALSCKPCCVVAHSRFYFHGMYGIYGHEQVTSVTLIEEAFSVENGILTPTMKLKRPQAKAKFEEAIDR